MTSMNAEKISIPDRGSLKVGYWGDVTLFDPATIADKATYENPHQYSVGVRYVLVNGQDRTALSRKFSSAVTGARSRYILCLFSLMREDTARLKC